MVEYRPQDWTCSEWKLNEDGHVIHPPHEEGNRFHVISYDNHGRHCSEPNCEVNFEREANR